VLDEGAAPGRSLFCPAARFAVPDCKRAERDLPVGNTAYIKAQLFSRSGEPAFQGMLQSFLIARQSRPKRSHR
jgi:hypothetical protein